MILGAIIGLLVLTIVYFLAIKYIIKSLMDSELSDGFLLIVGIAAIVVGTIGITLLWVFTIKHVIK
jgi:uncharacterized protein YjeT (DUF2065 family)